MKQQSIRVSLQTNAPLGAKAAAILGQRLGDRGLAVIESEGSPELVLTVDPAVGADSFRISGPPAGPVVVSGGDGRGLIYGVGKLLRTSSFQDGRCALSPWRGSEAPRCPVRGMYFATHFGNYYESAPLSEIERYLEDLALWGCNALMVWFDMHHYSGLADPRAGAMIARLHAILHAAQRVGIDPGLLMLANEAYADSPRELRASFDPATAKASGYTKATWSHYDIEICPSRPGGLEFLRKDRREMLQAFADLDIRYACLWPYDTGGCVCADCFPWGGNGFLRASAEMEREVHAVFPQARMVLSTWLFDEFIDLEWPAFAARIERDRPAWLDYIMVDTLREQFPRYPLEHGSPGGYPMINFPEISMTNLTPWGGYGGMFITRVQEGLWKAAGERLSGGFPYSEGIFEDVNKVVSLQQYWSGRSADETVTEYLAYEFGPQWATPLLDVIKGMEREHGVGVILGYAQPDLREVLWGSKVPVFNVAPLQEAPQRLSTLEEISRQLPPNIRGGFRWQLIYRRGLIDAALQRSGGRLTDELEGLFVQLAEMYHMDTAKAAFYVSPPSREVLLRAHQSPTGPVI